MKNSTLKKILQPQVLILLIFFLGFFLRVVSLDKNPPELFGDELDAGYQAYSLLKTGRDYKGNLFPSYLQSFSEWRAPLLMYTSIPFIAIAGLNEYGVRLPSVVFGSLTILLLYYLVSCLTKNKKLALLSAFFLAASPWHIQYSRAAFEAALMLFLITTGIIVFLRASHTKKLKTSALAGIIFALPLYTYNTANIFVPLIAALICFLFVSFSKQKKQIITAVIAFLAVSLPLAINILFGHAADRFSNFSIFGNQEIIEKINLMRTSPHINPFIESIFSNRPVEWTKRIVQNYAAAFSPQFLFINGDVTFRHSLHQVGQLFWFQLPLLLTGVFFALKNYRKKENLFWLGWLLLAPIPASLTIDGSYHATRLIFMVIPLMVLSACGGLIIIKTLTNLSKKRLFPVKLLAFLIILIPAMEFLNYQNYYWKHYPLDSWRWWHYGYKEAITSLTPLEENFDQVIIETTYEPALIRYLFWARYDPRKNFQIDDRLKTSAVDGLTGFCLNEKVCFVDFGGSFEKEQIKPNTLYLISQERNVPGDWDWSKDPPDWVKVIKTIKNPWEEPIFYLVAIKD